MTRREGLFSNITRNGRKPKLLTPVQGNSCPNLSQRYLQGKLLPIVDKIAGDTNEDSKANNGENHSLLYGEKSLLVVVVDHCACISTIMVFA